MPRDWFKIILLAFVSLMAAQVADQVALIDSNSSIVGTGVGFLALLLFGIELWPGVLLGSLLTSVVAGHTLELTTLYLLSRSVVILCAYAVQRAAKFYSVPEREKIEQTLHASEDSAEEFQEQLKVLHEVSHQLTRAGTIDNLCQMAVELGRTRLGFDRLGIWFFDEQDPRYTVGMYGTDATGKTRSEHGQRVPVDDVPMIKEAIRTHSPIYHRESFEIDELRGKKTGWNVISVLSDGDRNVGWLSADNYLTLKPLKPFQIELLRLYGLTIGHLVTRYQAEETLRKREEEARHFQEQLKTLNEVSLELSRAPSFDDLCRMAVQLGRNRFGFDRLGMWLFDPETQMMTGAFGTDSSGNMLDERQVSWKIAQDGEPDPLQVRALLAGSIPIAVHEDAPLTDGEKGRVGRGWMVVAPLNDGQRVIGTLAADNLINHQPLSKYQVELMQLYSSTVGHLCATKRAEAQLIELGLERERVRILTDFIRDASHEFRTPLSIIYTKLYLLEKNADPSRTIEHLHGIQEQSDTIYRLVESLVLMSQLDRSTDFHFASVSIAHILQGVVTQARSLAQAKNLSLTLDVSDDLPPVRVDIEKMYRALQNLVENAVRFTDTGEVNIAVRLQPENKVCIRIQDTGVGINELDLPNIFKRFYRVDKAHTSRGLGLGLPISRKIIEAHGGSIQAESRANEGTTITVMLPCEDQIQASTAAK